MRSIEVERADYALQFPVRGDGISVDISPSYGSDEFETELAPWIARHFPAMQVYSQDAIPLIVSFSNFRQFIFDGPANEASGAFRLLDYRASPRCTRRWQLNCSRLRRSRGKC